MSLVAKAARKLGLKLHGANAVHRTAVWCIFNFAMMTCRRKTASKMRKGMLKFNQGPYSQNPSSSLSRKTRERSHRSGLLQAGARHGGRWKRAWRSIGSRCLKTPAPPACKTSTRTRSWLARAIRLRSTSCKWKASDERRLC